MQIIITYFYNKLNLIYLSCLSAGMVLAALFSGLFGVTGYLYFGLVAVPLTIKIIKRNLTKLNIQHNDSSIFLKSFGVTLISYSFFYISVMQIWGNSYNGNTLITKSLIIIGFSISILSFMIFLFYKLPKIIFPEVQLKLSLWPSAIFMYIGFIFVLFSNFEFGTI